MLPLRSLYISYKMIDFIFKTIWQSVLFTNMLKENSSERKYRLHKYIFIWTLQFKITREKKNSSLFTAHVLKVNPAHIKPVGLQTTHWLYWC